MAHPYIYLRSCRASISYSESSYHSLLDLLKAHQVPIEYQCCSGYCGACRLLLLNGKVKYFQDPIAYIKRGEILPCCCFPINNIELDFIYGSEPRSVLFCCLLCSSSNNL